MCQQVNFLSVPFPKLEESVVRDFKLLSSAFLSDLLEIFLKSSNAKQNFQHGPIKIAELGTEVSHVGALALIKGFKFEGFLLQTSGPAAAKSAFAQQIRELLLQSKFFFFFYVLICIYIYKYINLCIVCLLRIGHTTPCKEASTSPSVPAVNPCDCTKDGKTNFMCWTNSVG